MKKSIVVVDDFYDNPNEITRYDLIRLGIATAVSPMTSHLALQYVSYPIQVVGKSAKTMAVFLFTSFLIKSKRGYNLKQKSFAFLIAAGAILYSINKVLIDLKILIDIS